jgi:hypothetical protein
MRFHTQLPQPLTYEILKVRGGEKAKKKVSEDTFKQLHGLNEAFTANNLARTITDNIRVNKVTANASKCVCNDHADNDKHTINGGGQTTRLT